MTLFFLLISICFAIYVREREPQPQPLSFIHYRLCVIFRVAANRGGNELESPLSLSAGGTQRPKTGDWDPGLGVKRGDFHVCPTSNIGG